MTLLAMYDDELYRNNAGSLDFTVEVNGDSGYEIPMPQQVFSSGTSNEVRMHKLGELRWVYVETLPSSAWPIMKDFWTASNYGLSLSNPNTGPNNPKQVLTIIKCLNIQKKVFTI